MPLNIAYQYSLASLLDTEEHGSEFGQPPAVDGGHAVHVLLGGHHELVVHDVVGRVPEPEQRGRRVQVAGHACAAVHVLADALQAGGLLEVRCGGKK